ncbi:hypothetical protein GQ43DRAFT_49031 [Delitschia confertaspora ATCC 74209]|uniref:Uncharacterized protein n=1 Tax=Delitschia confertaspora ATCC 74209 TaxID=1513339 RepID=A0A9P4MVD9_9PLEO|nr:hypothetical protein GQ43DRAFT_49031 [Delitschia confertaspora ATCC 74209]
MSLCLYYNFLTHYPFWPSFPTRLGTYFFTDTAGRPRDQHIIISILPTLSLCSFLIWIRKALLSLSAFCYTLLIHLILCSIHPNSASTVVQFGLVKTSQVWCSNR